MDRKLAKDPATYKKIDGVECVYMMTKEDGQEVYVPLTSVLTAPEQKCSKCGYTGSALHNHHVHGRKNSNVTIMLCANCHTEWHNENGWNL